MDLKSIFIGFSGIFLLIGLSMAQDIITTDDYLEVLKDMGSIDMNKLIESAEWNGTYGMWVNYELDDTISYYYMNDTMLYEIIVYNPQFLSNPDMWSEIGVDFYSRNTTTEPYPSLINNVPYKIAQLSWDALYGEPCIPEWTCEEWGNCIDKIKTRTCYDGCGGVKTETLDCIPKKDFPIVMAGIAIIIIIGFILMIYGHYKNRRRGKE